MEYIKRERYLQKLIDRMNNNEIKIVTGSRRVGKSWLLNHIFFDYLLSIGVSEENIIQVSFDMDDENNQMELTDSEKLKTYIYDKIKQADKQYYIILDEVQEVNGFEKIVNGLNNKPNIDVYITGSNSHFLSSDINTIFRGRGDEIHIYPLSFAEFCEGRDEPVNTLWKEYYTYGGLPGLRNYHTEEQKFNFLKRLWQKTYISDIVDRHKIKNISALNALTDVLCSTIGTINNPTKISNTISSVMQIKTDRETVSKYLDYLEESYLFESANRYNIKGKRYLICSFFHALIVIF